MKYNPNLENSIIHSFIPGIKLPGGYQIPIIGLGTFGSDQVDAKTAAETVFGAINAGYRHIDCASVYRRRRMWTDGSF